MQYVIFATDKPGSEAVRESEMTGYRDWVDNHPNHPDVVVHHAGPTLTDDGKTMNGTLILFDAPSLAAAKAFAADNPFLKQDIYADWHVRHWDRRRGGAA